VPKLAFIGNFAVAYSTESHHKATWERLGWEVAALQQQSTTTEAVLAACRGAQALQVTATHGWPLGGAMSPQEMLIRVREMGIPSFSYHLDLYFGLQTLDQRDQKIGQHWSWGVDRFYSTDGAHEAEYAARKVNHKWLLPAVVESGCYKGEFNPALASEVGFVGSTGYHPEYPFRTHMVSYLKKQYGQKFRVYTGMREAALNNTYASIRVTVGDHCFAGMPRYCSDRLFETIGRGGFIIYPETQDVTNLIPGLATYKPQDMRDLYEKIDYFLDPAHEAERIERRDTAFEWVKKNGTYTNRLQFIADDLGIG
jgi:hypothetical protein